MCGKLSSRDPLLLEVFWLLVNKALNHSIAVGLGVHYAHTVQLHTLFIVFVLFV